MLLWSDRASMLDSAPGDHHLWLENSSNPFKVSCIFTNKCYNHPWASQLRLIIITYFRALIEMTVRSFLSLQYLLHFLAFDVYDFYLINFAKWVAKHTEAVQQVSTKHYQYLIKFQLVSGQICNFLSPVVWNIMNFSSPIRPFVLYLQYHVLNINKVDSVRN